MTRITFIFISSYHKSYTICMVLYQSLLSDCVKMVEHVGNDPTSQALQASANPSQLTFHITLVPPTGIEPASKGFQPIAQPLSYDSILNGVRRGIEPHILGHNQDCLT